MRVMQVNRESGRAGSNARPWSDALWLAGQEIRRTWLSYPASAGYMAFMGLVFSLPGAEIFGTITFEIVLMAMGLLLATPFFARDYMSWSTDPIAERLAWWRTVPIGTPTIVRARAIAILTALPLNAIAFFAPAGFQEQWGMSLSSFLWFALAMTGVSLAGAGVTLTQEMCLGIRRWIVCNLVILTVVIAVIIFVGVQFDFRMFDQLAGAVEAYGPLTAAICLALGGAVFLGCIRLAEDGLRRRELTP